MIDSPSAPVRLLFFFVLTAYTYVFTPSRLGSGSGKDLPNVSGVGLLKNDVVFTWAFLEMLLWFWVRDAPILARLKIGLGSLDCGY